MLALLYTALLTFRTPCVVFGCAGRGRPGGRSSPPPPSKPRCVPQRRPAAGGRLDRRPAGVFARRDAGAASRHLRQSRLRGSRGVPPHPHRRGPCWRRGAMLRGGLSAAHPCLPVCYLSAGAPGPATASPTPAAPVSLNHPDMTASCCRPLHPQACSGHGTCDPGSGVCTCFAGHGFSGSGCSFWEGTVLDAGAACLPAGTPPSPTPMTSTPAPLS